MHTEMALNDLWLGSNVRGVYDSWILGQNLLMRKKRYPSHIMSCWISMLRPSNLIHTLTESVFHAHMSFNFTNAILIGTIRSQVILWGSGHL